MMVTPIVEKLCDSVQINIRINFSLNNNTNKAEQKVYHKKHSMRTDLSNEFDFDSKMLQFLTGVLEFYMNLTVLD